MLLALGFATALPYLICIVLCWRVRKLEPYSLRLAGAVGACVLCIVPAIAVQDALLLAGGLSSSFSIVECLIVWPFQLWVLLGGGVVQQVFEASARAISGHRQSTMVDNWAIYYGYTLIWVLPFAVLVASRLGKPNWRKDRVLRIVGATLLLNALAGVGWPWWGS
jgi:hypothetical protein